MIPDADRITPAYRAMQIAMHADPRGYGGKGQRWAKTVQYLATQQFGPSLSVLDYGCGQGSLGRALAASGIAVRDYDPAIPGKDGPPQFADIVVCTDVLEHVEPAFLHQVLAHLRQLARRAVFVSVALHPAQKMLPDGRNAHLIIHSADWWEKTCWGVGLEKMDMELPLPSKVSHEKHWIAVLSPEYSYAP